MQEKSTKRKQRRRLQEYGQGKNSKKHRETIKKPTKSKESMWEKKKERKRMGIKEKQQIESRKSKAKQENQKAKE